MIALFKTMSKEFIAPTKFEIIQSDYYYILTTAFRGVYLTVKRLFRCASGMDESILNKRTKRQLIQINRGIQNDTN